MEIMKMRAVYVTFCGIFITAVIATGSSENSFTEENNSAVHGCSNPELSINISGSVMTVLGKNFISHPFVTGLNLQGNEIEVVKKGAFDGLPELRYLNMAGNKINDLTSFGSHENLETLILANQSYGQADKNDEYNPYGYNSYTYQPRVVSSKTLKITERYPQLRYLDLSGNNIRSIDWALGGNTDYSDLSQQMPKLTHLDLSNNEISRLFFADFSSSSLSLMHIYLRNNNMEFANLKYFKNIVALIADNNLFMHLKKNHCFESSLCVSDMPKLKNLSVSNNRLNHIDRDFFEHMTELAMINFSNNHLNNALDGVFDDLISLTDLDLSYNQLTNISIFKTPSQLSSLSANWNKIEYVNSEDFINMANLKKLYLNNNNFSNIDKDTFRLLNLLEELHLAGNHLTNLPAEWTSNMKYLRYLDVTNNKFKYLESLSLNNKLPTMRIDLIGNKIVYFSLKKLQDISENVTIYLNHDEKEIELKTSDNEMTTLHDYKYN